MLEKIIDGLNAYQKKANGRFYVIGVDKFDYEDFWVGSYKTGDKAISVAHEKTTNAMKNASDHSIATIYYAYDPKGKYIGGDAWRDE